MKAKQLLIVIVAILFFQAADLRGQSFSVKHFTMSVSGTSNMHDWESQVQKLECTASYTVKGNALVDIGHAVIKIPVQSIKSPKGKIMDNKTYEAFDSEKHPSIIFRLSGKRINTGNHTADLTGSLTMAGSTKQIELLISYKVLPNGDLQILGLKKINMTDFKMEPPTAMMGAIKVGSDVTVHFDIVLSSIPATL